MKYYLIAGEASGDLHASNLMLGIKKKDPNAEFRFFGGDLMKAQGGALVKHYREMAFMGFLEVLMNIRSIARNLKTCKEDIIAYNPDVVILVDYPGFNLRIARFSKEAGFKVFYYIAPKVWAWKESRVAVLRKYVDQLFIIFPFEIEYFRKHAIEPIFEGNPSIDAIAFKLNKDQSFNDFVKQNNLPEKPIIALVAGSRKQEIKYNLPEMLKMVEKFPDYQFVIAGAPSLNLSVYQQYIKGIPVSIIYNQTYQLFKHSTLALVTSGTATLESALLDTPEVVCYKGGLISMLIAWLVIKVKYISLVNLNMNREVVTELKQYDLNSARLYKEASMLLPGNPKRDEMLSDFVALKKVLGGEGASERVGARVVSLLTK